MTHHPNTPASRNEGEPCKRCHGKGVVEDGQLTHSAGGILYACGPIQCVKDCPDCNGVGKIFASRTEQAAPSVASGAVVDVRRLAAEARANPGIEVALSEGTANAFRDALAAPGAAIAAREQMTDEQIDAIAAPWLAPDGQANDSDVRQIVRAALASRQEAPAASAEEWMPVTPEQHSKAFAAGDLMALAEEAGGARMAENVVQVTRSDIERIIYFAKNREDTAARSPATVAQPVDAGASRKSAKDAAEYEVREWMGENDVVLKSAAYRALITLVLAAQSAAQPCPSQGCGGDGGVETASMYAQKHGLAVTVEWMRGWNACLDAVAASSTDKGDGGSKE